jgi:aryl-alcohol dehydrogenase-like predicted oxidoreductase
MLHKSAVTAPIIGASKPHHLDDAVAALSLKLSPNEMAALEAPYVPHPVLGFS